MQPKIDSSGTPWFSDSTIHLGLNTWFLGRPEIVDFWGLGGPGGTKNHSKRWRAKPPTFWNGLGADGAAQTREKPTIFGRPKTMYEKPHFQDLPRKGLKFLGAINYGTVGSDLEA